MFALNIIVVIELHSRYVGICLKYEIIINENQAHNNVCMHNVVTGGLDIISTNP